MKKFKLAGGDFFDAVCNGVNRGNQLLNIRGCWCDCRKSAVLKEALKRWKKRICTTITFGDDWELHGSGHPFLHWQRF